MKRIRQPDPKNMERQLRFRETLRQRGGLITTITMDKQTVAAVQKIQDREFLTRREAIERAIRHYAKTEPAQ